MAMNTRQEQLMKQYNAEIQKATNKEETLHKIIQQEKNTIGNRINNILTTIMLIIIVAAIIHGRYIAKEIQIYNRCGNTITDQQGRIIQNTTTTQTNPTYLTTAQQAINATLQRRQQTCDGTC